MSFGFLCALAFSWNSFSIIYSNYIPIILQHETIINVNVGKTFVLDCPIALSNNPQEAAQLESRIMFSWTHESIPSYVFSTSGRYQLSANSRRLKLLAPAQMSDAGIYTCQGVTGFGNRDVNIRVNVIDPQKTHEYCAVPIIADPSKEAPCFVQTAWDESHANLKREVGQSVEMNCLSRGEPPPKYNWVKDKTSANWIDTAQGVRGPVLRIDKLARVHTGHYTCRVSNVVGTINRTFSLTVIEPQNASPKILTDFKNRTEQLGDRVVFTCKVACFGCEEPFVEWFKRVEPHEREDYMKAKKNPMRLPNVRPSELDEEYVPLDGTTITKLTSSADQQQHQQSYLDPDGAASALVSDVKTFISNFTVHRVTESTGGKYIVMSMDRKSHIHAMDYKVLYVSIISNESILVPADNLMVYIAVPMCVLIFCTGILIYCFFRRYRSRCCRGSGSSTASTNKTFRICNGGSSTRSTGPFLSGNNSSSAGMTGVGGGGSLLLNQQQQALLLNALASNGHSYAPGVGGTALSTITFSSSNAGSHNNPVCYYTNGMAANEDSLMSLTHHMPQSSEGHNMVPLGGGVPMNTLESVPSVNGTSYYMDQYSSIAASSTTYSNGPPSGIYYPGHNSATSIHKMGYPGGINNNNFAPQIHQQSQTLH